jgi:hypothetical protein
MLPRLISHDPANRWTRDLKTFDQSLLLNLADRVCWCSIAMCSDLQFGGVHSVIEKL